MKLLAMLLGLISIISITAQEIPSMSNDILWNIKPFTGIKTPPDNSARGRRLRGETVLEKRQTRWIVDIPFSPEAVPPSVDDQEEWIEGNDGLCDPNDDDSVVVV